MPAAPYQILATDYDAYAVVFSCTNVFGLFHTGNVFITIQLDYYYKFLINLIH